MSIEFVEIEICPPKWNKRDLEEIRWRHDGIEVCSKRLSVTKSGQQCLLALSQYIKGGCAVRFSESIPGFTAMRLPPGGTKYNPGFQAVDPSTVETRHAVWGDVVDVTQLIVPDTEVQDVLARVEREYQRNTHLWNQYCER